jgi:signal transduction histidine kinase
MAGEGGITAKITRSNGRIELQIADTGPGIPEKFRKDLFSPFSGTSRKDGSGLGLAIARELARAGGGDLLLQETSEQGTVFLVKLASR